jgi:sugar porter (SP) family MFS transporter
MNSNKAYAIIVSLIVSIGGLLLGLSVSISGAVEFFKTEFGLTDGTLWFGLAASSSMLGTFIGNFNAGTIADSFGRKKALILSAFLFLFCSLGSGLSADLATALGIEEAGYTLFLITRFIGGLGIGISLLVAPLYLSEFAPSNQRGLLVSFNQFNIVIGFSLAFFLNYLIGQKIPDPSESWKWMLGIGGIFAIFYFVSMLFVPESPRFQILKGKDEDAKKTMRKAGGEEHAETEFNKIKQSMAEGGSQKTSYGQMWKILLGKKMRLVLIVGLSIAFFQMATGLNAIMFFSTTIFKTAGFGDGLFQPVILGVVNVLATIISMMLIDRLGRKPLLIIGISIMTVSILIASFMFHKAEYKLEANDIAEIKTEIINDAVISKAIANKKGRS